MDGAVLLFLRVGVCTGGAGISSACMHTKHITVIYCMFLWGSTRLPPQLRRSMDRRDGDTRGAGTRKVSFVVFVAVAVAQVHRALGPLPPRPVPTAPRTAATAAHTVVTTPQIVDTNLQTVDTDPQTVTTDPSDLFHRPRRPLPPTPKTVTTDTPRPLSTTPKTVTPVDLIMPPGEIKNKTST